MPLKMSSTSANFDTHLPHSVQLDASLTNANPLCFSLEAVVAIGFVRLHAA